MAVSHASVAAAVAAAGCICGASQSANFLNTVVLTSPALRSCSVSVASSSFTGSLERPLSFRVRSSATGKENARGITNSATKVEVAPVVEEEKEVKSLEVAPDLATEAIVSSFMTDVANLVKLVDSRDIIELEMKHKDYEITIRKKEALAPPPPPLSSFPGPHVMSQSPFPGYPVASMPHPPAAVTTSAPDDVPVAAAPTAAPPASQHPSMLSPMAGTFYRSPGPGEPPFVQVGDQVTKGQVLCIVEAMKLMNEIEADQSGTIMEIVAEDGKPVSVDSPLFIIKP